jgi:protein SCO1/2
MSRQRRAWLAVLLAAFGGFFASCGAKAAAAPALPPDSVYRLPDDFTDQAGRTFRLADGRGKPRVVALFYTSCKFVCPLIVDSARGVERSLTPAEQDGLRILLVSLDPARDDTAALRTVADERKLDPSHWTLARTDENAVRRLAAVLGVRYRKLADGEFNHTSALVLLDRDGRVLARTESLGAKPDPQFLAAVRAAVAPASAAAGGGG